jgi:hypothetical protein
VIVYPLSLCDRSPDVASFSILRTIIPWLEYNVSKSVGVTWFVPKIRRRETEMLLLTMEKRNI